jgi:hypothetical protein
VKPPGNHQMKHQPEIVFHSKNDSFADPPQFANNPPLHLVNRWLCASNQKSTENSNPNKSLTGNA